MHQLMQSADRLADDQAQNTISLKMRVCAETMNMTSQMLNVRVQMAVFRQTILSVSLVAEQPP